MANLVFAGAGNVFPETVRRFNMLRPGHGIYRTQAGMAIDDFVTTSFENADYFKDWVPYNTLALGGPATSGIDTITFGAFTTAPDGTTDTARKIVETVDNAEHSVRAGTPPFYSGILGKVRFAGVFKYAGRRIVMSITPNPILYDTATPPNAWACSKAVFDLENGQVAVENAYVGIDLTPDQPWVIGPAHIEAVGDGWYLCSIDATVHGRLTFYSIGMRFFDCRVLLDNGTGTAAESSTYTGDGTSGVYAWRGNLLPTRAWDMDTVVWNSEFNSMSEIDINNTLTEGYHWYINGTYPAFDWEFIDAGDPTFPNAIYRPTADNVSVADGILSMSYRLPYGLTNFASTWEQPSYIDVPRPLTPETGNFTHGYVGNSGLGWVPPAIFETRMKLPVTANHGSLWSVTSEYLLYGRYQDVDEEIPAIDMEFWEVYGTHPYPGFHIHYVSPGPDNYPGTQIAEGYNFPLPFINIWLPGINYQPAISHVHWLGVRYTCTVTPVVQLPPPDDPTHWGTYTPADTVSAITPMWDQTAFNTYSIMWFPYVSEAEPGQIMAFCNGKFAHVVLVYGPNMTNPFADPANAEKVHLAADGKHVPFFLGIGQPNDTELNDDIVLNVDFVRVIQNG